MRKQQGFGGLSMYMGIILVVTLAASAAYFKYSQGVIQQQAQEVAAQTARAASAEANAAAMREDVRKQTIALARLASEMAENRKAAQDLTDTFAEHDLNDLVNKKPDLVQKLVNKGTADVFKRIEEITDPRSYDDNLEDFVVPEEEQE